MRTAGATLGIGTATFIPGYGLSQQNLPTAALLKEAIERGVSYIDTAAAYGDSEIALGSVSKLIASRGVRVCTKIQPSLHSADDFSAAARASLDRLRCDHVDTILLHSALGSILTTDALFDAWKTVTESGLALRSGASTYGTADAQLAAGKSWCNVLQVEYSILNQSVLKALRRSGLLPEEIVARSVLCKGLLTEFSIDKGNHNGSLETIRELNALANELGMNLQTLAIRFALDTPGLSVVIVGISSVGELDAAVDAWQHKPLTSEEWSAVARFDRSNSDFSHPERWL